MTKLNLGSKYRKLEGFDNLDKLFGWNFQDGLGQYADNSVDGITISHALMFLTDSELETLLKDARRVLRVGGVIRITEDDTENPASEVFKTGRIESGPKCLTGPNMMRGALEKADFIVYDADQKTTRFYDNTLIQAYRGGAPNVFFIEGVKGSVITKEIKNSGKPYEIRNCSRDELPQFFVEMGFKVGAEIGVYKGAYTEKFCKAGLTMYAIDPWIAYGGAGRSLKNQARQDFLYGHTQRTLAPYKNCKVIRKSSFDAVRDFETGSLDFVYIDGDHRFPFIAHDIYEWYSKIKKGGVIAGHDYFCTNSETSNVVIHVGAVVDAFVKSLGIDGFYTFGRSKPLEFEAKDDRYLSWMIIKK